MRCLALYFSVIFLGLSSFSGGADASQVKALFVGVNNYGDPGIKNLQGALKDVRLMQSTLRLKNQLTADPYDESARTCPPSGLRPVKSSITLVDGCATRHQIFDAWKSLIAGSLPGDTLLFYYSGHGSHTDAGNEQVGGQKISTIVPADARGAKAQGDILGYQVNMLVEAATQRGRNVLTIFDSCESGAASRDLTGGVREVPPASSSSTPADPNFSDLPAPKAGEAGYRVHLAAARRLELASESYWRGEGQDAQYLGRAAKPDAVIHGDFTMALTTAIRTHEIATYADLMESADSWLKARWRSGPPTDVKIRHQTLQAEGAGILANFLEGGTGAGHIYRAGWQGEKIFARPSVLDKTCVAAADGAQSCQVGILGGVTSGSKFTLYAAAGDAMRQQNPLGEATVDANADSFHALLSVQLRNPATTGSEPLWLRETAHVYPIVSLKIALSGGDQVSRDRVSKLDGVVLVDLAKAGFEISLGADDHAEIWKLADGKRCTKAVDVDAVPGQSGTEKITEAVRRIANYQQILLLPGTAKATLGQVRLSSYCDPIQSAGGSCPERVFYGGSASPDLGAGTLPAKPIGCAFTDSNGVARVPANTRFMIEAINTAPRDLYPYLFYLGSDYAITLLYPPPFATELIVENDLLSLRSGRTSSPGRRINAEPARLVLIMSDTPIPAEVLQQVGLPRGLGCEGGALAHLLCSARTGGRDLPRDVDHLGQWGVSTVDIFVENK